MAKFYFGLMLTILLGSAAHAATSCSDFTGIWDGAEQTPPVENPKAEGNGVMSIVQDGCTSYKYISFNEDNHLFYEDVSVNFTQMYVQSYTDYDHGYYTITTINGNQIVENYYYGGSVHQSEEGFRQHPARLPAVPDRFDKLLRSKIYTLLQDHPLYDGTMTRVVLDYEKGTFTSKTYHKNAGSGVWF